MGLLVHVSDFTEADVNEAAFTEVICQAVVVQLHISWRSLQIRLFQAGLVSLSLETAYKTNKYFKPYTGLDHE